MSEKKSTMSDMINTIMALLTALKRLTVSDGVVYELLCMVAKKVEKLHQMYLDEAAKVESKVDELTFKVAFCMRGQMSKKIQLIKAMRNHTSKIGLRAAKEFLENMELNYNQYITLRDHDGNKIYLTENEIQKIVHSMSEVDPDSRIEANIVRLFT